MSEPVDDDPADAEPADGAAPPGSSAGEPPASGAGGGRRRTAIVGAAVAVVLVAGVIAAVLLAPSDASGYSDEVRENFLAACTADGGGDVAPVCVCFYDEIVETIPYDRFEEVDAALTAQREAEPDAEVRLPRDFEEIRTSCVEEKGPVASVDGSTTTAPPNTAPTTAGPPETTTPPETSPPA